MKSSLGVFLFLNNTGSFVACLLGAPSFTWFGLIIVPQLLYRGDGDPLKERSLRTVYPGSVYGGLLTNLSNGGSGRDIFSSPLISTVNRHVDEGWEKRTFCRFLSIVRERWPLHPVNQARS